MVIDSAIPIAISSSRRNPLRVRSGGIRALRRKIIGVNAAHSHASRKASTTGPVGAITRMKPGALRSPLTADKIARPVQNAKISTRSRAVRRSVMQGRVQRRGRAAEQLVTRRCSSFQDGKEVALQSVFIGIKVSRKYRKAIYQQTM